MPGLIVTDQNGVKRREKEMIAGAMRGQPSALTSLYESYGGELLRLASRITGSHADAEDLLHDLFVGLPELLGRYEHRDKLGAWLRGVIARMAVTHARSISRRTRLVDTAGQTESPSASADPWNAVDLERAIASLPDDARAVFVLRQVEDHSHDEVAALLGITSGAARVRYLRAVRQLRAFLEPHK